MNKINFEEFGISFEINRVAFEIGKLKIYWYAVFIVIAILVALLLCKKDDGKYNIKFERILEILIFLFPISIICARLYYVLFRLDYYVNAPFEIFNTCLSVYLLSCPPLLTWFTGKNTS